MSFKTFTGAKVKVLKDLRVYTILLLISTPATYAIIQRDAYISVFFTFT